MNFAPKKCFLAKRMEEREPGVRQKMLALAREFKDVINLGRGDPDLKTPAHIIEAAKKALDEDATHYTPGGGLPDLRRAIAKKLSIDNRIEVDPENEIIVTVGAQEAIILSILSLINPGEEIIVPEPRYTAYDNAVKLAGGITVPVITKPEHNFEMRAEDVKEVITEKTKAILLISPNNPTGAVISEENLKGIADLAQREDLVIISDELYEKLVFDDLSYCSIASFPGMFERTITINGFSKAYSMTGWRVGYVAGPKDLITPMQNLKFSFTICASAVCQRAALAALTGPQDCVAMTAAIYNERRNIAMRELDALGIDYVVPKGAFYIFPDIRKFGMTSYEFATNLLRNAGVFTFPGTAFGAAGEGFIRISLLLPKEKIVEGFQRISRFTR